MDINRIPVLFYGKRRVTAPEISYKYNQKQVLELQGMFGLPDYFRVDFANEGDSQAKSVIGTPAGIEIPDEYLLTGKAIKVYIVLGGPNESVQTVAEIDIPVRGRLPATAETPTPAERSIIDELLAALNEGVGRAETAAAAAEESETNAKESEDAAKESEDNAKDSENAAADSAKEARSYAKGGTGTRTGEDSDNAKYYSERAQEIVDGAIQEISEATDEAVQAVEQEGERQTENARRQAEAAAGSASAAEISKRNAKNSEDAAKESEDAAKDSENAAKESEDNAKDSADAAALSAKQAEDAAASVISLNFTDFDTGDTYGYGLGIKDGYPALKIYMNDTEG